MRPAPPRSDRPAPAADRPRLFNPHSNTPGFATGTPADARLGKAGAPRGPGGLGAPPGPEGRGGGALRGARDLTWAAARGPGPRHEARAASGEAKACWGCVQAALRRQDVWAGFSHARGARPRPVGPAPRSALLGDLERTSREGTRTMATPGAGAIARRRPPPGGGYFRSKPL